MSVVQESGWLLPTDCQNLITDKDTAQIVIFLYKVSFELNIMRNRASLKIVEDGSVVIKLGLIPIGRWLSSFSFRCLLLHLSLNLLLICMC